IHINYVTTHVKLFLYILSKHLKQFSFLFLCRSALYGKKEQDFLLLAVYYVAFGLERRALLL
ncbi:hypothetical protein, partial [Leptospira fluminis]|uniref:hypothetical protein n=1 Tax=Leptospira fluminis TaxID=2484979 RepID=UPI001AEF5BAC